MALVDLTGQRFGRWTVLAKSEIVRKAGAYWLCQCDCGTQKEVSSYALRNGDSTSCGCYHNQVISKLNKTHGKSKTRLYNIWAGMRERCNCESYPAFRYYGAKGVKLCKEWDDYSAFEAWALANGYDKNAKPHHCTLDRIDNSKGYSPDNCRWVNSKVQSNNQSRNRRIDYAGKSKTIAEWSEEKGWPYSVIYNRIVRYRWSADRALTEEPRDWGGGKCKKSA